MKTINKKASGNITLIIFGLIMLIVSISFFAFSVKIPVGYTGIKVNLYGSEQGAQPEGLNTGRNFYNSITHDVFKYPVFIQQIQYSDIRFQDKSGLTVTANIGMDYKFDSKKIGEIYSEYKVGVDTITNQYMGIWIQNAINTTASKYEIDALYGSDKEKFRLDILETLQKDLGKKGIIVNNVYFTGDMVLPQKVKERINLKIEATQKAMQKENELRSVKADAQKEIEAAKGAAESRLIKAKSIADANKLINASLTPELIEYKQAERWDGKLPTVTGDNLPIINFGQ